MKVKKLFIEAFILCSFIPSVGAKTVEYKTTNVESSATDLITTALPVSSEKTVALSDVDRVTNNMNTAITKYQEEQERLAQEELERKLQEEIEAKAQAEKEARAKKLAKAYSIMSGETSSYNGDAYSLAQSYVGRGGDCFAIATQFINEYFGYGKTSNGYYQVDSPQAGDLIYYANGGLGTTHYAVYLGNGYALQGNFEGIAQIKGVYLNGASDPIYYRYN